MNTSWPLLYRAMRRLIRAALGVYFPRIEYFHQERVPLTGPVLFTSNHPNSLTDAFVIGTSVPRKVNFVATVQLFQWAPLRWLLTHCGVIPINRVKDDPRAMRTVLNTFEACFHVLEQGEAVGIFPEGITHDDPQLKTVKSGAARMALELEHRHSGTLGLRIVPVGLTFSSKDTYRSKVLVHFGEPIDVSKYFANYGQDRHHCIQALSAAIEQRIQSLILHLPHLERARTVEAVKRLYLDRLWVGNTVIHEPVTPQAGELLLTQAIAQAVDFAYETHPERATEFSRKLDHYQGALRRLHLADDVLAFFPSRTRMIGQSLGWAALAIVGAPVALYGWVHRLIPYAVVCWAVKKFAKKPVDRTHVSTASLVSGLVAFTTFYGGCVLVFHQFFGWTATLCYAGSLPLASLAAHYYVRELRRFAASFRAALVFIRLPGAAQKLTTWRTELIQLIETERAAYLAHRGLAQAR